MADISRVFTERHAGAELTFVALSTTGKSVDFTGKDDKTAILVANSASSASDLTIAAGTGIQGVADITISIPASKTVAIRLDSGEFKQVSGDNKGCVILKGASTLTAAVVELVE